MKRFSALRFGVSLVVALACLSLPAPAAHAEIEKIAVICDQTICPHWWPKLAIPPGWEQDEETSERRNINALVPKGQSFDDAVTVIYANAVYKPRVPALKSLAEFVADDRTGQLKEWPDASFVQGDALLTGDGRHAETWLITPGSEGYWERVAYLEEGDYYLVFVASSQTKDGLKGITPAFDSMLASYKE